ncbi:CYFA0S08e01420g1_1 [Cyberlindnera fabianii]|uniref:Adenylate kinase isoenzyme 6 homolog n=1 Tax=Cyberlindnera fabianii TaxID=36022 RepID=A0A061AWG4_CYBFA|nr:CYFA0S08e01420g1_1 [Cyberlindnera fabianii]
MSFRPLPNIIITGTPGCGKTSHAEKLVETIPGFKHINITDFAKENECFDGYDEARKSHIVDEDKLVDALEPLLEKGGVIIDWHACDFLPERLIDLVIVLRTSNSVLYERLSKRGYSQSKIDENIDCEIMEVIAQEARDSYVPEIVIELESNSFDDLESNVSRIASWVDTWKLNNPEGASNELAV